MADYYVREEDGTSRYILEDGSGFYLLETSPDGPTPTDTGLSLSDALASLRARPLTDAGLTISDSAALAGPVSITDTGLSVTDALASVAAPTITDRGLSFGTVLVVRKNGHNTAISLNEDAGLAVSDSISVRPTRKPTDTGVTITTAAPQRLIGRAQPTTTGLTVADSISDIERYFRTLTDTGLSFADSIFGGHGLTDQGMGGFASGPISDNFNRADENPLSDGGQWTRVASGSNAPLKLVSNAATGVGPNPGVGNVMVFSGAGAFADCDVWITLNVVPTPGQYVAVLARQAPGVFTGQSCYRLVPAGNGFTFLQEVNIGGGVSSLGSWPITLGVGDSFGLRCLGNVLTAYYRPAGGGWTILGSATDSSHASGYAGLLVSDATARVDNFGASAPGGTDSLQKTARKFLADTGLSFSDGGIVFPVGPDIGLNFSTSLHKRVGRFVSDIGLPRVDDSLGKIALTDTGLTVVGDSVTATRIVPRGPTDTGLSVTDSIQKTARKVVADTGMTLTITLVATKNGSNPSVNITDIGLVFSTTLANTEHYFRSIPIYAPETGLSISDGIRRTTTPPLPPPRRPSANFTFSVSGETVTFTDTSTPGSAPIGSWSWNFGDSNTSSATNPVHTYAAPDTYNVTLVVTTVYGHSSVTKPVTTSDAPVGFGTHIDAVIF